MGIFMSPPVGDYDIHSNTYVIDSKTDMVTDILDFPASELYLCGDSLYYYSTEYSKHGQQYDHLWNIQHKKQADCDQSFYHRWHG